MNLPKTPSGFRWGELTRFVGLAPEIEAECEALLVRIKDAMLADPHPDFPPEPPYNDDMVSNTHARLYLAERTDAYFFDINGNIIDRTREIIPAWRYMDEIAQSLRQKLEQWIGRNLLTTDTTFIATRISAMRALGCSSAFEVALGHTDGQPFWLWNPTSSGPMSTQVLVPKSFVPEGPKGPWPVLCAFSFKEEPEKPLPLSIGDWAHFVTLPAGGISEFGGEVIHRRAPLPPPRPDEPEWRYAFRMR